VAARRAGPTTNVVERPKGTLNEARWAEIVAAAAEVFYEVGYPAATLQEIASRVGLLKGSLYYYIESKEDLLFAVIETEHERGLGTIVEDEDTVAADPATRLAAFIGRWMRMSLETLPQRASVVRERRHLGQVRNRAVLAQRNRLHRFVRDLVIQGIAAGDFDPSTHPGLVTNSLFALMDGAQFWYRDAGSLTVDEIAEWYVMLFLRALRPSVA